MEALNRDSVERIKKVGRGMGMGKKKERKDELVRITSWVNSGITGHVGCMCALYGVSVWLSSLKSWEKNNQRVILVKSKSGH